MNAALHPSPATFAISTPTMRVSVICPLGDRSWISAADRVIRDPYGNEDSAASGYCENTLHLCEQSHHRAATAGLRPAGQPLRLRSGQA
jgi:hypothetical protein